MRYVGLLLPLAAIGLVVRYAVWVALLFAIAVLCVALWKLASCLDRQIERYAARRAAALAKLASIAVRADEQHAWVLAGDARGIYGDYQPAIGASLVSTPLPSCGAYTLAGASGA